LTFPQNGHNARKSLKASKINLAVEVVGLFQQLLLSLIVVAFVIMELLEPEFPPGTLSDVAQIVEETLTGKLIIFKIVV
jgi:hypothetical protein